VCGWHIKLCDLLVINGPYLSTFEMHHDNSHYFTLSAYTIMLSGCPQVVLRRSCTAHLCHQAVEGRRRRHTRTALVHRPAVRALKFHNLFGQLACLQEVCQRLTGLLLSNHVGKKLHVNCVYNDNKLYI